MTNNNSNLPQNSTPPRASFASALAQKPAPVTASKSESPVKASPVVVASPAPDQSPVVKLPSSTQGTTAPVAANSASKTPVITIDGSKPANPIKFGSFAAAAASMTRSETVSAGPTLPPRTQSAPPSVVEQQKQQQTAATPFKEEVVVLEAAVVLPAIQEDIHHQHQQQEQQHVSFNYDGNQQQQRPPRYHHNPNNPQRYYNPQHQQQQHHHQQQYYPQQYQQQPQYHHSPNYRGPHQNYRPRPQYHQAQGGYYHPGMAQGYYPPPQGYYRPPQGQPQQENMAAPAGVPFQRPAPAFNNFVAPPVAPVVPANMPAFSAPGVVPEVTVAPVVATAAAPVIVKPAPAKIKIVDPTTGKELNFGSKTSAPSAAPAVEETKKEEAPKPVEKPAVIIAEPVKVAEPVKAIPVPVTAPVVAAPAKKISIVIKDPNSHKELDLSQVVSRPVVKEDLAVEELTAAFSESTKLEDFKSPPTPLPCESPAPAAFEHDKEILANLNVDDDELGSDSEEDDEDYSDYSSDEEEEIFIPSTVQYNQSISYPEGTIPFKAPSDDTGVWLYSREFMLQFREKCTTTPGDLQERLSAAVKKAKEFASSDRLQASDRPHRRDHREDRKKRRNHNGAVGPQAHLLDMHAVLKNRAENAWAPVRSAEELSQVDRILREVKGLLNKLTLEKFHLIFDKILSLGIMSPDVLSGVIDIVFDKSVSEPRFAPMYAELCYKIVVEELNGLKKTLPANDAHESKFRRLLVERCQAEYKHKRAWSKKRLEKLLETPTEETAPAADATASEADAPKAANVGELTEEDYLLIKLKRRVLGNMRFIGEIFKVGLIGEKIMHSIITELLSNVENPEEEEIECLCRLLMTIGSILDKAEAANFWNQYVGRMNWLISQSGKLSSRVRFLVMDTLELREKKWKTGKAEEGPKTIAQIQKEQQTKERNEREKEREYRDQRDQRDHRGDRGDHRGDRGNRQGNNTAAPPMKFSSKQSAKNDEWNRSGPSKTTSGQLNRGPSVRRPPTPSQASPTLSNSEPVAVSPSVGRFGVLNMEDEEIPKTVTVEAPAVSDAERVKKIVSLLDELVQMNNFADVFEEIKLCGMKSCALSGLLNRAIESGKKPSLLAVIRVFSECPDLTRPDQIEACKLSFSMIDDLAVDVPSVYEIAGQLYSALHLSLQEIFDTLVDCSDDSAKTRVILYTAANSPLSEKETLLKEAKEFVEKNKKSAIENLIKKLAIEI